MDPRSLTVGERIELRRKRVGLSRRVAAQLTGRSEEWLRQIERGAKPLDSIEMLYRLAEVLHIDDPIELMGLPATNRSRTDDTGLRLTELSRAIMDHPSTRVFIRVDTRPPPSLDAVRASVEECWTAWLDSDQRYTDLSVRLPDVLTAARAVRSAARTAHGAPIGATGETLVRAYHLARVLLARVGGYHLAWLVADRTVGILADATEPSLIAVSSWHVASALLSLGYYPEARDYALAAAQRLAAAPVPDPCGDQQYGALQLIAAECAAADGDLARSEQLWTEARRLAEGLDPEIDCRDVWFGPIESAITGMDIALRLGRVDTAIKLATEVDLPKNGSVDTRVRYFLTTAHAYSLRGEDFGAIYALQQAKQTCSQDIRYDVTAHRTLQRLARRNHHLTRRELAELLDVAGLA